MGTSTDSHYFYLSQINDVHILIPTIATTLLRNIATVTTVNNNHDIYAQQASVSSASLEYIVTYIV